MNYWVPFRYMDNLGNVLQAPEVCWVKGIPYFSRKSIMELLEISEGDLDSLTYRSHHITVFSKLVYGFQYSRESGAWVWTGQQAYHPVALLVIVDRANNERSRKLRAVCADLIKAILSGRLRKRYQPDEVVELLAFPPGRERMQAVLRLADRLGVDRATVYRRLRRFCLENGLPVSENPASKKKTPENKGG